MSHVFREYFIAISIGISVEFCSSYCVTYLLIFSTMSYRNLLRIAASPMPFALVQMGRTFIFIWVVTIPFVLSGGDFLKEYPSAFSFVILLTYGFLGLEFVSRMLSNPFGDEIQNDLNVKGMGSAAVIGIDNDSRSWREEYAKKRQARAKCGSRGDSLSSVGSGSLRDFVQNRQKLSRRSGRFVCLDSEIVASYISMEEEGMIHA